MNRPTSTALVLGCGSIGSRHARNLRALGVAPVLYDVDRERAERLSEQVGGMVVESPDQGWRAGVDATMVCAPTSLHADLTADAIRHDSHVFLEKPLAHTLEAADRLIAVTSASDRVTMVGYNARFHPSVRQAREWLREGRIGSPVSARLHFGQYLPGRHPGVDYRVEYAARAELGGGVLLDAIHEFDIALWLFGEPRSVHCVSGNWGGLEIDVEDVAETTLEYPAAAVSVHLNYLERPQRRTAIMVGPTGKIEVDLVARTASVYDAAGDSWTHEHAASTIDDDYREELTCFLDALDGRREPPVDAVGALRSIELVEACKRSAGSREVIPLPLSARSPRTPSPAD